VEESIGSLHYKPLYKLPAIIILVDTTPARFPTVVVEEVAESEKELCEAAREGGVRRRRVAWRAPLKESLTPPRAADDDGFESLNGSGEDKPDPEQESSPPRYPGAQLE